MTATRSAHTNPPAEQRQRTPVAFNPTKTHPNFTWLSAVGVRSLRKLAASVGVEAGRSVPGIDRGLFSCSVSRSLVLIIFNSPTNSFIVVEIWSAQNLWNGGVRMSKNREVPWTRSCVQRLSLSVEGRKIVKLWDNEQCDEFLHVVKFCSKLEKNICLAEHFFLCSCPALVSGNRVDGVKVE